MSNHVLNPRVTKKGYMYNVLHAIDNIKVEGGHG